MPPVHYPAPSGNLHVVFSAECIPAFDWQSAGLFYSFYQVKQPGKITRLLACSQEQLKTYPKTNLEMGPTFVHKNLRFDPMNDAEKSDPFHDMKGTGYASYNKPYSVTEWLKEVDIEEDYVLMMDTDMFLRAPVNPVALGVKRGTVVSAEYTYLVGTMTGFADRFIDKALHPRMAQVGGFHIFHKEDLREISPLWLKFTKEIRNFANLHPTEFYKESFHPRKGMDAMAIEVSHKQARWHTEMYGYVFAAAQVGVTHRIRRGDVMLYPGYEPYLGRAPLIMHYGSDYTLGHTYFNKMMHLDLRLETCPDFLFADPGVDHIEQLDKKDALSLEHLSMLNAAFCKFYSRINCSSIPDRCGGGDGSAFLEQIDAVQPVLTECKDDHEGCSGWVRAGECVKNPLFMHTHCAVSCESCSKSIPEIVPEDAHLGDWKYLAKIRSKGKEELFAYIEGSEEDDLGQLEEAIGRRRENLKHKFEL